MISEINSTTTERLVRRAAAAEFGRGKARPVYEHGHWWVLVDDDEGDTQTFDVVDANTETGLAFEQVG